jgi:malate synthase
VSILREWLHQHAPFTEPDAESGVKGGETLTPGLLPRQLDEEHQKLKGTRNKDVHDDSKGTTLPIAREIVDRYVCSEVKPSWYVDLLNLNLDNDDLPKARAPRAVPQRLQP